MKSLNRKCLLLLVVLLGLAPMSLAAIKPNKDKCRPGVRCQQVPEGGSALVYLVGAGITCLGAMVVRSRSADSSQS
jgi:hypothetical protein